MKEHAQAGNIVFFSSHIIDVVERICDKIAIIRKGQIQCVRDVHEMEKKGESLEKFYMSVINDSVVEPIAVNQDDNGGDSDKGDGAGKKGGKIRNLFKRKNKNTEAQAGE